MDTAPLHSCCWSDRRRYGTRESRARARRHGTCCIGRARFLVLADKENEGVPKRKSSVRNWCITGRAKLGTRIVAFTVKLVLAFLRIPINRQLAGLAKLIASWR